MAYLNCPRCALSIRMRDNHRSMEHCPRCLARAQLAVPLYVAGMPHRLHVADPAPAAEPPASPQHD